MEKTLTEEILRVCQILNKNSVQYLIVGGTAVAFHGYFRWSQNSTGTLTEKFDLDIWYNPTYENYFKPFPPWSVSHRPECILLYAVCLPAFGLLPMPNNLLPVSGAISSRAGDPAYLVK